jgi:hypothetical protein
MGKLAQRYQELSSFEKLVEQLDETWIAEALEMTGTATVRHRRLPAEQVLWLVLGMALYREMSIPEVVAKLGLALPGKRGLCVAPSAVPQARARLGEEPVCWLFDRCAEKWATESARRRAWHGLSIFGIDGSSVRVPDSGENREHFGGQSSSSDKGQSGYPLARLVTLMALRSHLLLGARLGPYAIGEATMARELWPLIPNDSLCIVDRGFLSAPSLVPYSSQGSNRHWLTRAKSNTKWRVLRRLGKNDELVELTVSGQARRNDPELPKQFVARAIRYRRLGFKPQTLLTSLLDPKLYPASEILALYHERWELELGFDELKTEMLDREETLRSKSPGRLI